MAKEDKKVASDTYKAANPKRTDKGHKTFGQKYVYVSKVPSKPTKGYDWKSNADYSTWEGEVDTAATQRSNARSDYKAAQNVTLAAIEAAKKARRKTGTYSQGKASRTAKMAAVSKARSITKSKAGKKGKGKDTMKDKEREEESISMKLKSVLPKNIK